MRNENAGVSLNARYRDDQLWLGLVAAQDVFTQGGTNHMFFCVMQGVEQHAVKSGWIAPNGRPMCWSITNTEWHVYSPSQGRWVDARSSAQRLSKETISDCLKVLGELQNRRESEIDQIIRLAMARISEEPVATVENRLKKKAKRGRPGAMSKGQAIDIHERVVALSKTKNISQNEAAHRLSMSLQFSPRNWPAIRKMATR